MAGHSKWHNIQHRKGAQDAKRGKIFTKLIKEIVVASRIGGSIIENNPALRQAVDKGLAANMKKDTIDNAIKRGSGELEGVSYEEVRYEGYGIAGVAILLDCLTDNRKRTVAEVRHAFSKYGGNLGTDGSVAYQFNQRGLIGFAEDPDEKITEMAIELSVIDAELLPSGELEVLTEVQDFHTSLEAFKAAEFTPVFQEIIMHPENKIKIDATDAEKLARMLEHLEDLDDTRNVYHNADF